MCFTIFSTASGANQYLSFFKQFWLPPPPDTLNPLREAMRSTVLVAKWNFNGNILCVSLAQDGGSDAYASKNAQSSAMSPVPIGDVTVAAPAANKTVTDCAVDSSNFSTELTFPTRDNDACIWLSWRRTASSFDALISTVFTAASVCLMFAPRSINHRVISGWNWQHSKRSVLKRAAVGSAPREMRSSAILQCLRKSALLRGECRPLQSFQSTLGFAPRLRSSVMTYILPASSTGLDNAAWSAYDFAPLAVLSKFFKAWLEECRRFGRLFSMIDQSPTRSAETRLCNLQEMCAQWRR